LQHRQAEHERLRDAVQHGTEHDRQRRPFRLRAGRVLPFAAAVTRQQPVTDGEDGPAHQHEQPDPGDRLSLQRLVDEFERDRADQQPGTESHHGRNHPPARREPVCDQGADQQRGGAERSPEKRFKHVIPARP
jgi:hypothetical protein